MIVGFTGTRHGMTLPQRTVVSEQLRRFAELHHGDCVGADQEAHDIAAKLGLRIEAHPPLTDRLRAFCRASVVHEPREYFTRNRDIVDAASELLAAPDGPERQRSGTWLTVRYAVYRRRTVTIVHPDGSLGYSP